MVTRRKPSKHVKRVKFTPKKNVVKSKEVRTLENDVKVLEKELDRKENESDYYDTKCDYLGSLNRVTDFFIFLGIVLVIGLVFFIPNIDSNIDEDLFCKNKLDKWFPEQNFENVHYTTHWNGQNNYYCAGDVTEGNIVKRDGLVEVDHNTYGQAYILVDQQDIDYLNSDDNNQALVFLGVVLILISIMIFVVYVWVDYDSLPKHWRLKKRYLKMKEAQVDRWGKDYD